MAVRRFGHLPLAIAKVHLQAWHRNVRFWHMADIELGPTDVRFWG